MWEAPFTAFDGIIIKDMTGKSDLLFNIGSEPGKAHLEVFIVRDGEWVLYVRSY